MDHLGRKALVLALEDDEPAHGSSLDLAVDRMKQASKPGASRSGRGNVSERGQLAWPRGTARENGFPLSATRTPRPAPPRDDTLQSEGVVRMRCMGIQTACLRA